MDNHQHQEQRLSQKALSISVLLSFIYIGIQFYGAQISGSLALAADASHMIAHALTMVIAFIAANIAYKRKATQSNGWKIEVFGGFLNALILIVTALILAIEVSERFIEHEAVDPVSMGIMASIGFLIHLTSVAVLFPVRKNNLNIYAAFIHISFDVAATLVNIITSILIFYTKLPMLDNIATVIIVLLISISGIRLIIKSSRLLLDTVPRYLTKDKIREALLNIEHIQGVHSIQVRPKGQDTLEMSAHIVLCDHCQEAKHWIACQAKAQRILQEEFGIAYSVLQIEYESAHTMDADS